VPSGGVAARLEEIPFMNQRWLERQQRFRPVREVIRPSEYDIEPIGQPEAKHFVVQHHYAQSLPADRFRFGLFRHGVLVGVAVFSHPTNDRVLTNVFGGSALENVELGRLVLLDEVPGNGESWFVARCFHLLKGRGIRGVLAFSDPVERLRADGTVVMPGHVGTVYQALNAAYLGQGTPRTLRVLPDGTVFSARAQQKVRAWEQGWEYASGQLVRFGADPLRENQDGANWLNDWLPRLTRTLRHPGNFRYAWTLTGKSGLNNIAPYPKKRYSAGLPLFSQGP